MTLSEKISHLCEENGITRNKFEIESGVGRGQTARWDKNKPSGDKLQKAAEYFGVSIGYLLDDAAPATEDGLQSLANDERALLLHYRTMTETDREMMRDLARRLKNGD